MLSLKVRISRFKNGRVRRVLVNGRLAKEGPSSCRRVYLTKQYVVKVSDEGYDGQPAYDETSAISQNKKEVKIWKKVSKSKDKKFFAPVLAFAKDFSWIVMKRIYGCEPGESHAKILNRYGCEEDGQYMEVDGIPVAYDYGY